TIESLDHRVVGPLLKAVEEMDGEIAIALLPDHPTPCRLRTHTSNPVPLTIWKPGVERDSVERYSEKEAAAGGYGLMTDDEFIREFLR
ncbi:MAG: phosphoglycerate mutase, partial [Muribaculaceae bacterium]|nr:phosphoglycerate mutase [Muribaculaceae bacterium]